MGDGPDDLDQLRKMSHCDEPDKPPVPCRRSRHILKILAIAGAFILMGIVQEVTGLIATPTYGHRPHESRLRVGQWVSTHGDARDGAH